LPVPTETLRYDLLLQKALRGVLREALREVAATGLPGAHHLYITFRTQAPGVTVPPQLMQRYPDEMTVVLQHEYWGLEVEEERFAVTLSFNNKGERLSVPFAAVVAFADPSVNFGLQFQPSAVTASGAADQDDKGGPDGKADDQGELSQGDAKAKPGETKPGETRPGETKPGEPQSGDPKVVTLDRFRRK
jgi:uncharacterized protein